MRILQASPEAVPFSKTGGLADVAGALSKALADAGHDVWLVLPHYPPQYAARGGLATLPTLEATGKTVEINVGYRTVTGRVLQSELPGSAARVLFVEQPEYFDRPALYVDPDSGLDYHDNCERFVFFSRAVMEIARAMDLRPDVVHAHDWQSGLVMALLAVEGRPRGEFRETAGVFTIHNMAFHGRFPAEYMPVTGLDRRYFNPEQMEFWGGLNLLKTGIVFADRITTVSPTYAREIQTEEFGCGLDGVLRNRGGDLVGVLNGVDTETWNPATDELLPVHYNAETVEAGKAALKARLQEELGLPRRPDVPLIGMISRLTDQKGLDLLADCAERVLQIDLQLCVLGSGEERYERLLTELAERHPQRLAVRIGYDESLAHRIEAGADAFLMPSRFEPCGLNQMYSQIYGTVPIVRSVGGLADSVVDATGGRESFSSFPSSAWERDDRIDGPDGKRLPTPPAAEPTGFCFTDYTGEALVQTIERALETYRDKPVWKRLVQAGMRQVWSWKRSAAKYVEVYEQALRARTDRATE